MAERTREEIETARAARKAALAAQQEAQELADLEALDAAELEHGDNSVAYQRIAYTPGLPTLAIVRAPSPTEIKRFQDMAGKARKAEGGVNTAAAVQASKALVAVCLVYPSKEVFASMVEARPMLDLDLGNAAIGLAGSKAADEGKE